ncbi:MAG: xylan 1,4-beta-xylosidase, partial [Baekduia sp.]|nr:xylan 1,4-beta-xylosidase [Baekduia sp.]
GFSDGFSNGLQPGWEWLYDAPPELATGGGTLTESCAGPMSFVARQVVADRLTATTLIDAPRGDAAVGLAVNLGTGVRGIEVRHGRARAFVSSPQGVATGPSVAVPVHRPVRLTIALAPGGALATYVADASGGPERRVEAGPAAAGSAPTRVALTCRGRGAGRFAFARVHAG